MNNLNLSKEDVIGILYGEDVLDEKENIIYEHVSERIYDIDIDKSSITKEIVIKETSTGKLYKAKLKDSEAHGQDDINHKANWVQVQAVKGTCINYEEKL